MVAPMEWDSYGAMCRENDNLAAADLSSGMASLERLRLRPPGRRRPTRPSSV